MGRLTVFIKDYFATTPKEQLRKDWEELSVYNRRETDIRSLIDKVTD